MHMLGYRGILSCNVVSVCQFLVSVLLLVAYRSQEGFFPLIIAADSLFCFGFSSEALVHWPWRFCCLGHTDVLISTLNREFPG